MKAHLTKIVAGAFLLAVAILGFIGVSTQQTTLGLMHASTQVTHTREVLENLEALDSDVIEAESSARGYLITGKQDYLEPYQSSVAESEDHFKNLRTLTMDNPHQQDRLDHLQPIIQARLRVLKEAVALRGESGLDVVQQRMNTGEGKRYADEIKRIIAAMKNEEEMLLARRTDQANASARNAIRFAWFGSTVSILLLALGFELFRREIIERQRAEAKVTALNESLRQRAAELEEANSELEAFSYSVSHDLRAPLRHINGFVEILSEQTGNPDPKSARYLKFIGDSARHLGNLVDDLLAFSRMARTEMQLADTDLNDLVRDVRTELGVAEGNRSIDWRIGNLPVIHCDTAMLRLVFVNLLSNAIKYTGRQEEAEIEVGTTTNSKEHVIFVRDNGVGFEMKHADKLFGVFQRLHHAEEFEGTGIGLANVRRIIQRHGGRTWAEGNPGKGATFYFSIPKVQAAQKSS